MLRVSQTGDCCKGFILSDIISSLAKLLDGFARTRHISRTAKIYHGNFDYDLIPDTGIYDFSNMQRVTSVEAGDCYVCVFEKSNYQGNYLMICPGEKVDVLDCGSIITSMQKFSLDESRNNGKLPGRFWELSGPTYHWHFSRGYKFV